MSYLLDTHVWVWWASRDTKRMTAKQFQKLDRLSEAGELAISSISLWEVANLVSLERLRFTLPLHEWLEAAAHRSKVKVEQVTPSVAAEVATLPDSLHRDPADRLIIATARANDQQIFTIDPKIIDSKTAKIGKI